ncbi:hypothetical protein FN846DRAFT_888486 [Sphaerosporella brunnea]|uniref:Fungal-type protein kinase domain-containing protein n=1 Tax=Sphaerosporella brunnea TaxID=1250544 RepID=A0A5J5F2F9_9PEZI|nr:hypothetical protein FN846DRAFT_888486 [Sphaerosporella brunnea]
MNNSGDTPLSVPDNAVSKTPPLCENRRLSRVRMGTVAKVLNKFSSSTKLLTARPDGSCGHSNRYRNLPILDRDDAGHGILIVPPHCGCGAGTLIDLEPSISLWNSEASAHTAS